MGRIGQREWCQRIFLLAVDMERDAAGHQHLDVRGSSAGVSATSGAAASTRSKLSSTRSRRLPPSTPLQALRAHLPFPYAQDRAHRREGPVRGREWRSDRRTRRHRGSPPTDRLPPATASRVLPTPPGPVMVSNADLVAGKHRLAGLPTPSGARSAGSAAPAGPLRKTARRLRVLAPPARAAPPRGVPLGRPSPNARPSARRRTVSRRGAGLAPRSRLLMPLRLSPARSASASCDRPAVLRNRRSTAPNDAVLSSTTALPASTPGSSTATCRCAAPG